MLPSFDWSLLAYCVAALAFGYLLGSIPFGLVLTKLAGTQDIRAIGSGNIGATNVLRTGRKGLAAATLVGDALKGTLAVVLVSSLYGRDLALAAALGAFLGHLYPGRQGRRDLYRDSAGADLAGRAGLLSDLGRGGGAHPLLLAFRPRRQRRDASHAVDARPPPRGAARCAADGAAVDQTPGQPLTPAQRHRGQDRQGGKRRRRSITRKPDIHGNCRLFSPCPCAMLAPILSEPGGDVAEKKSNDGVRLTDEQRLDWLQLIRSDNVGAI